MTHKPSKFSWPLQLGNFSIGTWTFEYSSFHEPGDKSPKGGTKNIVVVITSNNPTPLTVVPTITVAGLYPSLVHITDKILFFGARVAPKPVNTS